MSTKTVKHIETLTGTGRLELSDRYVSVQYVIRVFQEYAHGTPTLKSATGGFANLKQGDAAFAIMDVGKALDLELEDGRHAEVIITDMQGSFHVAGPIQDHVRTH